MALIYGMEQEDYDALPKGVQESIKMAHEQKTETASLKLKLEELEKRTPIKEKEVVVDENPGPHNNWKLDSYQLMGYETRRDQLLDQLERGADKKLAVAAKKYKIEILELLGKSHPSYAANAGYVKNAVTMVVGNHLAEILAEVKAGDNEWFSESGSSSNNTDDKGVKNYEKLLDDEQKKAARNFKISYEEFYNNAVELGVISK